MCGIVGILGTHEVAPMLVEALKRLEYRGYDSAGIATVNAGRLDRRRAVGKLVNLSDLLVHEPLAGKTGIGHTRWATHGAPTVANAHPHRGGPVAVVHNGIIENFRALRDELADAGYAAETQTDTEVVALLAQRFMDEGSPPRDAARQAIARLDGAFALAFLFDGEEDLIVAARKGSPLAVGHGDGEMFLGSDAIALAPMTDRITYLEEGDRAEITRAGALIFDASGAAVERATQTVSLDATRVDKAGHKHFMAKEIAEQPTVLAEAIAHYVPDGRSIALPDALPDFAGINRVVLVACGTAFYACETARYWFERIAGLPAETDIASEFRYRDPLVDDRTMAVLISQSGETADTLAALREAKAKGARTVGICNVQGSMLTREACGTIYTHAGPEIGVASTKAFTAQLVALTLFALKVGRARGVLDDEAFTGIVRHLYHLPAQMEHYLDDADDIESLAKTFQHYRDFLYLGRGVNYPIALEGALKLKEISYIHAEGYPAGEMKHGPIALIDENMPVVAIAPDDAVFEKVQANVEEVKARAGIVLAITDDPDTPLRNKADFVLTVPRTHPYLAPLLIVLPLQLLAYHVALLRGCDVDQPRNLAKSVTVE
jgi:glucosamine--fructose-6-phosphate aminotransferase (isomerizing)